MLENKQKNSTDWINITKLGRWLICNNIDHIKVTGIHSCFDKAEICSESQNGNSSEIKQEPWNPNNVDFLRKVLSGQYNNKHYKLRKTGT
jgi:hypothetical protein